MRRFSLLLPIALLACSDDSTTTGTGSSGVTTGSGMGGSGVSASSSTGLTSTTSSSSSGTGGAPPVAGAPGSETVSAGDVCSSPNYKMIMTFGQPTQNQAPMSSDHYKVNGGLIGATN